MRVRAGRRGESAVLSDLAIRSKSYWGYDSDFLDACREELQLNHDDFDELVVRVAEDDDGRTGRFLPSYRLRVPSITSTPDVDCDDALQPELEIS